LRFLIRRCFKAAFNERDGRPGRHGERPPSTLCGKFFRAASMLDLKAAWCRQRPDTGLPVSNDFLYQRQ
jgi:hypothetical protein